MGVLAKLIDRSRSRTADESTAERVDYPDGNNATASIELDFEADTTDLVNCWFNIREDEKGSATAADSEGFSFNSTVAEKVCQFYMMKMGITKRDGQ